jgi:hypothetical protein
MKARERERAIKLRKMGWSVRAIAKEIHCAKSSVSEWVRDIILTEKQISKLKSAQDRGREKAANHPNSSRAKWARIREAAINSAKDELPSSISTLNLRYIGAALYWAEGYTATRNLFVFANCDPAMIRLMKRFLVEICHVPAHKFRGRVNIHPHLDIDKAQKYWSKVSGIPLDRFHRPLLAVSRASKQKRRTLPYGTFRIVISDVYLCCKIKGWIERIKLWAVSSAG